MIRKREVEELMLSGGTVKLYIRQQVLKSRYCLSVLKSEITRIEIREMTNSCVVNLFIKDDSCYYQYTSPSDYEDTVRFFSRVQ